MKPFYIPSAWYWAVSGKPAQVYSSAAVAYVPVTDPTYVASGIPATPIVEQDLIDLLILAGVPVPAGAVESDSAKTLQVSALNMVELKALFNHENRIRALESKAPITAAQFVTALKALL